MRHLGTIIRTVTLGILIGVVASSCADSEDRTVDGIDDIDGKDDSFLCDGDDPAGCSDDEDCALGFVCRSTPDDCIPSACACDASTGMWACTPDCGGGACVTEDDGECEGPNPAGCSNDEDCDEGLVCDLTVCASSACDCMDGDWVCLPDCGGGACVPEPACEGPNPAGCFSDDECAPGFQCVHDLEDCRSTDCACDPTMGVWVCTPDCMGGSCVAM